MKADQERDDDDREIDIRDDTQSETSVSSSLATFSTPPQLLDGADESNNDQPNQQTIYSALTRPISSLGSMCYNIASRFSGNPSSPTTTSFGKTKIDGSSCLDLTTGSCPTGIYARTPEEYRHLTSMIYKTIASLTSTEPSSHLNIKYPTTINLYNNLQDDPRLFQRLIVALNALHWEGTSHSFKVEIDPFLCPPPSIFNSLPSSAFHDTVAHALEDSPCDIRFKVTGDSFESMKNIRDIYKESFASGRRPVAKVFAEKNAEAKLDGITVETEEKKVTISVMDGYKYVFS